jgi:hypothetical protein
MVFTAYNYKKCGKCVVMGRNIKELWLLFIKKSVVRFGMGGSASLGWWLSDPPPYQRFCRFSPTSTLLLFLNWMVFGRVFYKWVGYRFLKVGGGLGGGVFILEELSRNP